MNSVSAKVCLDTTQIDRKGRDYNPSGWYIVPLPVIDQAVELIISGGIVHYVYDKGA